MEIAVRASRLLFMIRSNWSVPGEPADVSQLLADYESQDEGGREARISRLVNLPENQGIPAVCRIICYERSLLVAKRAALRLLEAKGGEAVKPDLAATLQKGLGKCRRAPARWVLAWLQTRHDPQTLAGLWTQLAADEEGLLLRQPARDLAADRRGSAAIPDCGPAENRSRRRCGRERGEIDQAPPRRTGRIGPAAALADRSERTGPPRGSWKSAARQRSPSRPICFTCVAEAQIQPRRCGCRGTIGRPGPET